MYKNKSKNPFFSHADIQLFLAYRDGGLSGRIAAITNENHNKTHNDNIGFLDIEQSQSHSSVDFFELNVSVKFSGEGKDTILIFNNTERRLNN